MTIRFLRVVGVRSTAHQPGVVAIVDDNLVKWNLPGWSCGCDDWALATDDDSCQHVDAVADLLDDRVLGDAG